jgi:hypothetical protein
MSETKVQKVTVKALGRENVTALIRNPKTHVGALAASAASRMGLPGTFEILHNNQVVAPQTPLEDLPLEAEAEVVLVPELTPA